MIYGNFGVGAQSSLRVKTNECAHAPTTPCIPLIELQFQGRRTVVTADAEQVSSDGGVIPQLRARLLRRARPTTDLIVLDVDSTDDETHGDCHPLSHPACWCSCSHDRPNVEREREELRTKPVTQHAADPQRPLPRAAAMPDAVIASCGRRPGRAADRAPTRRRSRRTPTPSWDQAPSHSRRRRRVAT